ncbi:MAG: LUD domain-containing protein [Verrucomicrobiota bacterium]
MSEREKIFARIREALAVKAPLPGHHHGPAHTAGAHDRPVDHAQEWLPPVGNTFEQQVELFRANAADLKADFYLVNSTQELDRLLLELRDTCGWKKAGAHAGKLTDAACQTLALPTLQTDGSYDVNELEACDVGITECDALIAQTGSVIITSRSAGGRALSVLPPHHLVLARRDQLLPDLLAGFALLKKKYAPNFPSMMSVVTGPSRTGDIERILVLGAHGPKKLTILCQ